MLKRIFKYLLVKYSNNEKDRIEIQKVLNSQITETYREQTVFGNVYNANIEFIMSQPLLEKLINDNDKESLVIVKRGLVKSTNEAITFIDNEIVNPKTNNKV